MNSDNSNPYQSPAQVAAGSVQKKSSSAGAVKHPYQSASGLATFTMVMLGIGIAIDVLSAGSSYMQIQLLERAQRGDPYTQEEADANDIREGIVGLTSLGCYVVTAVGFLMWFYRVHRNLPALGATNLDYSPGWAVGSFFVPFLNLFRPYQVMSEVWKHSRVGPESGATALVGLWWGAWIINGVAGQVSFRLGLNAESLGDLIASTWMDLGLCLISPIAALLAINVVRTITRMQDERHENMAAKTAHAQMTGSRAFYN